MKTVIFDFDGTIADTFPFVYEIVKELAPKYGFGIPTKQDVEDLRELPFREIVSKYKIGPIKLLRMTFDAHAANGRRISETKIFPGLKEALVDLKKKGFTLAIMSSNAKKNIDQFLKINDLNIFSEIETSLSLFGKGKKILKTMQKLKSTPSETIYVGDEVRDINAAKEAGIRVISVTWGYNTPELIRKNNPVVASTTEELEEIIDKSFK